MIIKSVALIYFSPTGTTKDILCAIAEGMNIDSPRTIDITFLSIRNTNKLSIDEDILIIGVPVYEERIPKILYPFLNTLKGNKKPVVLVAVYGNIGDGIVLNELKTITENLNFKVVAAGSFIGEHSFSTKEVPVAEGRPDQEDLRKARDFGAKIIKKLEGVEALEEITIEIPKGRLPLMAKVLPENSARMLTKIPFNDKSLCNDCGICVKLCPMSAINKETLEIDNNKCLRCFCCVKRCPNKARKIVYKRRFLVSSVLTIKSRGRKEPKIY